MLFTIGTSNRTAEEFFAELARRNVWLLVDVRSNPNSRNAWATSRALEVSASRHGIRYTWSGLLLGGRNPIATTHRDFAVAAEAVLDATDQGPVAMFCAEGDPALCHRSWKVAAHLAVRHGFLASHVMRDGAEQDALSVLSRTSLESIPDCLMAELRLLAGGRLPLLASDQLDLR